MIRVNEFNQPHIKACSLKAKDYENDKDIPQLTFDDIFPPRSVFDLLAAIERGDEASIHVIEWVKLFTDLEGWHECAPVLNKKLVLSFLFKALSNEKIKFMALSRLIEYASESSGDLPEVVYDSLDAAIKISEPETREPLILIKAFRDEKFEEIAKFCFMKKEAPRVVFKGLGIYFSDNVGKSISKKFSKVCAESKGGVELLVKMLKHSNDSESIENIETFALCGGFSSGVKNKYIFALIEPIKGKFWSRLTMPVKEKIYAALGSAEYENVLGAIRKVAGLAFNEKSKEFTIAMNRLVFWEEYKAEVLDCFLIVDFSFSIDFIDYIRNVPYDVFFGSPPKFHSLAFVAVFKGFFVAQFLSGPTAEIRFYTSSSEAFRKKLKSGLSVAELRMMNIDSFCDHVYGWQVICKRIVETRYGLSSGRKSENSFKQNVFQKRKENLESWLFSFIKREHSIKRREYYSYSEEFSRLMMID